MPKCDFACGSRGHPSPIHCEQPGSRPPERAAANALSARTAMPSGKFTCAACGCYQRKGKSFKVTASNLPAVLLFFAAAGTAGADNLQEGVELCTKTRQFRGANGKADPVDVPPCISDRVAAQLDDLLVGRHVTRVFGTKSGARMVDGTIVRLATEPPTISSDGVLLLDASIQYEAVYEGAPGGAVTLKYTQEEAQAAVDHYETLQLRLKEALATERHAAGERGRRAAAAAAAANAESNSDVDVAEVERVARGLRWPEVMDPAWWEAWGMKVTPHFHSSLFGFPTPSAMCDFFEAFFPDEAASKEYPFPGSKTSTRLSNYEVFALSLMRARTGWDVQFLAALSGVNRGRLGSATGEWIKLKLGPMGRTLIGVPHIEYLLESVPNSFRDCNMGKCVAVGDASDFMTETPRTPFMKKVRNMMWSDKVHHSAARGGSFCSGNGMNIAVLDLVFARASETAIIRAMAHMLASLPPFVHVAYDKGVRGMRSMLPNFNFVFMPCFLAPSKGKTRFTASEVAPSPCHALARVCVDVT